MTQKKGICAMLACLALFVLLVVWVGAGQERAVWQEQAARKKEPDETRAVAKKPGAVEETPETVEGKKEEETEPEKAEEAYTGKLLVTAPADSMALREKAGFGKDNILADLPAGLYLRWDGETATVGDLEFYRVTVEESGMTGYVAAEYCIPVECRYDPALLSVVDVTDARYTYEEMRIDIETLCEKFGDRLSCEVIGLSVDGRELFELTLGSPEAKNHIFVQAAIHGREYMTAQLVMRMAEYYAAHYDSGSYQGKSYRELFRDTAVHIVPMSNPDGVTISQFGIGGIKNEDIRDLIYECYLRDRKTIVWEKDANGDMAWADYFGRRGWNRSMAKNGRLISFREYQTIWKSNANGVDLNNNFDADWEGISLKTDPAYRSHKGPSAASEPEAQALVREAVRREYLCYLSYHAKGQLIYYDVKGNDAQTSERSQGLAAFLEQTLKYEPFNTKSGYNVNLGGFSDWLQLSRKAASVTIENGKHPCPLGIQEFEGIWSRSRESWAALAAGYR